MKRAALLVLLMALAVTSLQAQWPWPNPSNNTQGNMVFCIASIGSEVFIGTGNGVYRSSDSGSHWQHASIGLPNSNGLLNSFISSLAASGQAMFATDNTNIYRSTDSGLAWTNASEGITTMDFFDGILGGNDHTVFFLSGPYLDASTDNGNSWNLVDTSLTLVADPRTMLTVDSVTYVAGSWLIATNDKGLHWRVVAIPPSDNPWFISSLANIGNRLFEINGGQVLQSMDNGMSWDATNSQPDFDISSLVSMGTMLFAYGYGGIFRSSDSGSSWGEFDNGIPLYANLQSLYSNGGVLFAATESRGMYRSLDSGQTWSACNTGIDQNPTDLGPLMVYPNPTSGSVNVISPDFLGSGVLTLYSQDGRPIWNQNFTSQGRPQQFNLPHAANGLYWLELTSGTGRSAASVRITR